MPGHAKYASLRQLLPLFVLAPRVQTPAGAPSFHPGFELVRLIRPLDELHQRPGAHIGPAERPRQVASGQPDSVSRIHVEVFVVAPRVDYWVSDGEVAHVPDDVAGVPYPPREFDSLVCVPEGGWPSAALVEGPALHADCAFPHREHIR